MIELQLLPSLIVFFSGVIVGVLALLGFNKIQTGSASASALKKQKDQYQSDVEAHFEETSKKFKAMTSQYQDLYQHLSVGATTLCRPENIAPGLAKNSGAPNVESIEAKPAEPKSNGSKQDKNPKHTSKNSAKNSSKQQANKATPEKQVKTGPSSKDKQAKDLKHESKTAVNKEPQPGNKEPQPSNKEPQPSNKEPQPSNKEPQPESKTTGTPSAKPAGKQ